MLYLTRSILSVISGLLVATAVSAQTPEQISLLTVTIAVYPEHGLPAIAPSLKVTVTNHGNAAIAMPPLRYCLLVQPTSGAVEEVGCELTGIVAYAGPGDGPNVPAEVPRGWITIRPQQSVVDYVAAYDTNFFFAPPLLQPGSYDLSVRLLNTGQVSNAVRYVIDTPQGDDASVWTAIKQRLLIKDDLRYIPFLDDRLDAAFAAKPTSAYAKVRSHYADMVNRGTLSGFIQRLKGYLAAGQPQSFDGLVRVELAVALQQMAKETATRTEQVDDASVQLLDQGRALLQGVASSSDFVAAAKAATALQDGVWTRQQLQKWVDDITPKKFKPIHPRADCVVRNLDRTLTAWFGYDNQNQGVFGFPVGPENGFSPAPADRGQPTTFEIGKQRRVFSVPLRSHDKLTWTLNGKSVTVSADDGESKCEDDDE